MKVAWILTLKTRKIEFTAKGLLYLAAIGIGGR